MLILALLSAAAAPLPAPSPTASIGRVRAVAVARILPGVRIALGAPVGNGGALGTTVLRRDAAGRVAAEYRLVEFQ